MGEGDDGTVIRIRGLPWSATVDDIIKFFDGVAIKNGEEGVHLTLLREGRPSGEAYIEVETEEDVALAKKKHNNHMGRRYIEVFRARKSELEWVVRRNQGSTTTPDDEGCLRLRGLPYGCSKEEIIQFFSGLEIVPNGIALPTDCQGRHTGEAYVQFLNKEVAEKALLKHKEKIAHRYIEIFRSNLIEVRQALIPKMRGPGPMGGGYNRPSPYDSRDRFGGMNRYNSGRGRPGSFNDYDDGPGWNNGYNDGPGAGWGGRGGGRMMGGNIGGMKGSNFGRGSNFNTETGHRVHMRGLPYRATEMDIADFFCPLNPVHIDIIMDKFDRPSGEADVEFASHDDAVKAMSKNKSNMQHRYIELFLNSTPEGSMGMMGGGGGGPMGNSGLMGGSNGNYGPVGGPVGGPGNFGPGGSNFGGSGGMGPGPGGFGGGFGNRMGGGGNFDDMGGRGNMNSRLPMQNFNSFNNGGGGGFRGGPGDQMSGNNYNSFC